MLNFRDTSAAFAELVSSYELKQKAIPVSFRDLVPWLPYNSPRYTHGLHAYPAKVIPQIPYFFLSCRELISSQSLVLDPFAGSGTVALEACLGGHRALASDSNPLARLITRVKTTPLSPGHLSNSIEKLCGMVKQCRSAAPPPVINIDFWYHQKTIKQLSRVAATLSKLHNSPFKRLAQVAFSATARKLSLADPRVGVPVRLKPERYSENHPLFKQSTAVLEAVASADATEVFFKTLKHYSALVTQLWHDRSALGNLEKVYCNSLGNGRSTISSLKSGGVDAILTSPPYLGAQKYIRASSLNLGWLSMTEPGQLRALEDGSIGREHFPSSAYAGSPTCILPETEELLKNVRSKNPLRAHIASRYLIEMNEVLGICYNRLRNAGHLILVSGCNMLCGEAFNTTGFLREICVRHGFRPILEVTDIIKSRGLMTRRNKTASLIPLESVSIFQK